MGSLSCTPVQNYAVMQNSEVQYLEWLHVTSPQVHVGYLKRRGAQNLALISRNEYKIMTPLTILKFNCEGERFAYYQVSISCRNILGGEGKQNSVLVA